MKKWIDRLSSLSEASERIILGIMSGTSMDGIDLALCRIRNHGVSTEHEVLQAASLSLDPDLNQTFQKVSFREEAKAAQILRFQAELQGEWCRKIRHQMESWETERIDLLASHGQTILHLPGEKGRDTSSWQIVDGDHLAFHLGLPVISDFRQKHIAAGYEGAPLAPLAERLLFFDPDEKRILLNLGGIANFTLLDGSEDPSSIPFATDCGPANTLIDETVKRLLPGMDYDPEGRFARKGRVVEQLLERLVEHPFLTRSYPKSTGQEDFSWEWLYDCMLKAEVDPGINDLLATVTEFTALTVGKAVRETVGNDEPVIYVSGGGWFNRYLMERIGEKFPGQKVVSSSELGIDPEMKEAILFAVLANETVAGNGWKNEKGRSFTLGKVSLPGQGL